MSKLFYGSICLTDLIEKAKQKHQAFKKSEKNGKIYADISIWLHDQPDQYDKIGSIQLSAKEKENRPYIGNFKESDKQPEPEITTDDVEYLDAPLPF